MLTLSLLVGACTDPLPWNRAGDRPAPVHSHAERGAISSIGFEEFFLAHQSGELLLIDARDPWFYQQGRIPGAINLPTDESMAQRIAALLPDLRQASREGRPIIVYCNGVGCHDARTVARGLAAEGFDVSKFTSGWKVWKKSGLPVESASQKSNHLPPQPAS